MFTRGRSNCMNEINAIFKVTLLFTSISLLLLSAIILWHWEGIRLLNNTSLIQRQITTLPRQIWKYFYEYCVVKLWNGWNVWLANTPPHFLIGCYWVEKLLKLVIFKGKNSSHRKYSPLNYFLSNFILWKKSWSW